MGNKNHLEDTLSRFVGQGPYLVIDGEKYIDAASGTFNLPLGYTNQRIAEKLKQQIDRCTHLSSAYTHEMSQYILSKLVKHTPKGIDHIWLRDVSGSGAVECAIRIAQKATGRSGIISFFLAHHGQSLATAQISGNAFRIKDFHINIDGSIKIPAPTSVLAESESQSERVPFVDLEQFIQLGSSDNIACLIIEPIQGNGGNNVFPVEFYRKIRDICHQHGIIIIADEVQTGFGRTGTFFASTGYAKDLEPDIIVFAKGAGGIGIPTGGVLMRHSLDVLESFEHSSTSGANPLSLVALNEVIDIIEDDHVLENVQQNEGYLRDGLLKLQHKYPEITGVRGVGYMYGFDTPSPEFAARAIATASRHHLILRGSRYGKGKTIKVRPPLICTLAHLDEILYKLDLTFAELTVTSPVYREIA
ncbi:aspartate aminotransferase family protein [Xenorhabdus nematophila]|uniref:4-aminobutyrate aminotransferase, PLP-dependent n=1 Tax=Xenorhabdus nematophila (strain ATCC 19061 / DSM 3370 / CCUG 14189 / LMG 1036 / NCIMB 9965 / AN6) TaxID=406817 RepID=D3VE53_XENNA|nr:aspartate aminotransferase family protein [Xenorhabdus nematophila]CEE90845.1 putative 4-aminobutyrate aminotransferase, PLP-dependent [Xenorhabdus nematophila str. Anatoliense]CEF29020.1 putative 4-aminobutyrate aminotransferase, PLP-dependent [Xenorhabdus nematophila str. Websteri]AYA41940.1 aspartate aminotransferase family protein [Xenorhabdus nematophila]KHD28908.1 acetylornithine aminotransferase [Xenorhabdus nematophila]MBA0020667.1 aspartate aminotransferase family protein [Xenorhab